MSPEPVIQMSLRRDRAAAGAARRALEKASLPGDADARHTTALLTTELVNNAVLHGCGDEISFNVRVRRGALLVEVADAGNGFDPRQRTAREDPGGWGLDMVDMLSSDWGMHEGSTHVWFELRV